MPPHLTAAPEFKTWMANAAERMHKNEFGGCLAFADEETKERFIQRFHDQLRLYSEEALKAFPAERGFGYSIYHLSSKRFKEELIAQMFDRHRHETGNYIPVDLVEQHHLREWGVQAAEAIHQIVFKGREELTVKEKEKFIRLFNRNLRLRTRIVTNADSENISCKDRIDRAAESDAEEFAYLAILNDCMNDPAVIKFFEMLVFARAIIVRKRSIIDERLERLIETVQFMLEHQAELKKLHTDLFPGVKVTTDKFPAGKEGAEILPEVNRDFFGKKEEELL